MYTIMSQSTSLRPKIISKVRYNVEKYIKILKVNQETRHEVKKNWKEVMTSKYVS